ncbi:MAG: GNAT family N-acetyltransferase [Actinomycetota bacterium]
MSAPTPQRTIEIRPYKSEDYAACRDLWVELAEHHRKIYDAPWIGGDDPGAGLDEFLANEGRLGAWVASESAAIVGLAGLLKDGDEVELEPIIVSGAERGRGIERNLVDRVFAEARERGMRRVSVRAVARNVEAMAFYRSVGFRTLGLIELMALLDETTTTFQHGLMIHGEAYDY